MLLFDTSSKGKDYKIRILQFKLRMANKNLDKVYEKISKGILIDTQVFNEEHDQPESKMIDLYIKTMILKNPIIVGMMSTKKRHLLAPSLLGFRAAPKLQNKVT